MHRSALTLLLVGSVALAGTPDSVAFDPTAGFDRIAGEVRDLLPSVRSATSELQTTRYTDDFRGTR